ncbi:acyltransferase, partial [Acinetobacter baumannii]
PINIGNNVYLGTNTIILPGVSIGNNVIVGAGSLVNKDLADNAVYAGIPAKFIKTLDDYYTKCLKDSLKLGHLSAEHK